MASDKTYFPALDQQGWVTSESSIADLIFSHFFVSDYSQTQLYLGQVSSLPWILQANQDNINTAVREAESTLKSYFQRYFNNVVVEVSQSSDPANFTEIQMSFYVSFTDKNGKPVVLGRVLDILDNKISKVKKASNG